MNALSESLWRGIFAIGSALIFFVAARNSITWHLQKFWGFSADFWEAIWAEVHSLFEGDPYKMAVWGTVVTATAVFWFFNILLVFLDLSKPNFLHKYKIQDGTNMPVDSCRLRSAIKCVLFNHFIVGYAVVHVFYWGMMWRGASFGTELPTLHRVVLELAIMVVVEEICFYYAHRLMHHPRLYKHIHKIHHEWTAPIGRLHCVFIGITSFYSHPIDHALGTLLGLRFVCISIVTPVFLCPIVCCSHIATAWLWFSLALINTTISHSGYHFPFLSSPEAHDFHHLKFNVNYGVLGVLDRLHGTDALFRSSKAYERHFTALSSTPLREAIPDEPKARKMSASCAVGSEVQ